MAGERHRPRGERSEEERGRRGGGGWRGKILLRHMFLCRYVNPRVSLDGIDVYRVGHWGCFCRARKPAPYRPPRYNLVEIVYVKRRLRRLPASSSADISRVSSDAKRRDASLLFGAPLDDVPINVTEDYVSFCRREEK